MKGQRLERRTVEALRKDGYEVFRLYQPAYTEQGPLDVIAVGFGRVRFVQVRSNQWRVAPVKAWAAAAGLEASVRLLPSVEIWKYDDGTTEPTVRIVA